MGWGSTPSGTLRFKKIDGSFWNGETFRFADYIKIVLVEKNKTAKWLSEQVGRNVTSVSRWCTNASQPDLETLFRIAELLDVDVRELLHVEKDKSK